MSRAYRIRISETLERVVHIEDGVAEVHLPLESQLAVVVFGARHAHAHAGGAVDYAGLPEGLAAMLEAKPDAVVMVGPYAPLAAFIKEARAAGLKSQLATVSFVGTDNLVAEVGKDGDGVLISQVEPGSFAEDIGLQARDVLLAINRQPVNSVDDVKRIQATLAAADPVAVQEVVARGAAHVDVDNDGDQDLVLATGTLPLLFDPRDFHTKLAQHARHRHRAERPQQLRAQRPGPQRSQVEHARRMPARVREVRGEALAEQPARPRCPERSLRRAE